VSAVHIESWDYLVQIGLAAAGSLASHYDHLTSLLFVEGGFINLHCLQESNKSDGQSEKELKGMQ
jgi:hypothetical protein